MPKMQFVDEIQQHSTPQIAISSPGISIGPRVGALGKTVGDNATAHADIANIGNVSLTVDIEVEHYRMSDGSSMGKWLTEAIAIAKGATLSFVSDPVPITIDWPEDSYGTRLKVYETGTINQITGGSAAEPNTFSVEITIAVSITNLYVT